MGQAKYGSQGETSMPAEEEAGIIAPAPTESETGMPLPLAKATFPTRTTTTLTLMNP
jgi:hypothetical protein